MWIVPLCYRQSLVKVVKGLLRLLVLAAATSTTVSSGQTLVVNGINDYAAPGFVTAISATADMLTSASRGSDIDLIPLTVMVDSSSRFTTDVFRTLVSNYTASDDVFNIGFFQCWTPLYLFGAHNII